jgi:hypothetical protein
MTELFDRFEVNRVPRWPLMSRLVALSVVAHGLFLVAVVYVPTLRSMLYVAGNVSGLKFVSEDYDPTLVGQRATIVQLGPHEKLYYPSDYFGPPAVEQTSAFDPMMVQQAAPPPPPVYRPRPMRVPRVVATPTPQPSPSPELAQATPSPAPSPADAAQKQAEDEINKIEKETGVKRPVVNTKPLEDVAFKGKELFDQGKLDLKSIEVTATAERNDDGTLKPETVKIDWGTVSDENTATLAQQLITAISQSKVLANLEGAKGVRMVLKLDQQNVSIKIISELPSELVAKNMAEGFAGMVFFGRIAKRGTNEGELYNNLKFNYEGKQFTMSFEMPKDAAGKMIADILAKKAAAAQNKS